MKYLIILVLKFLLLANTTNVFASDIYSFIINGNERISKETIILFSNLKKDEEINSNLLNNSLKNLYDTGYFEFVDIELKNNQIIINVVENKIIQSIEFSGVKNKSILEQLNKLVKIDEKSSYFLDKVKRQKNTILNFLRTQGFYFTEIDVRIKENKNNSVNIYFNIETGKRAVIKTIKFIGVKNIKTNKLKRIIASEENKFWKFITKNKYLDVNRIKLDERLISNYLKNKGYYNASVESSFAELTDENSFELTFKLNLGEKYYFNNIKLNIPDVYSTSNFKEFDELFEKLKNNLYSLNSIEKILKNIDNIALREEFEFVNATYQETITDGNNINLLINLEESEKFYIDRINIFGNFITEEKVIRNSLIVDEGDPFNEILFNKSIQNLKAKNYFKQVDPEIINSTKSSNSKIINITVEEKPTGEIFAGLGAGTDGTSISAGIKENNYLGKGISLNTNLGISDTKIKGLFSVTNPNFRNTDREISTTVESSTLDYMSLSGYKSTRTGFSLGTSFEQYDDLFFSPKISTYYEKISTSSNASENKQKQQGDYFETLFTYGLTVNKLNQNFQPSEGYRTIFTQTLPFYSADDFTLEHALNAEKYITYADDLVFSAKLYAKAVNSINEDVRISKRAFIPSRRLRGFTAGKIGPIDGGEFIGGNYASALNLTTDLPILNEVQSIDFNFFFDAANVWGVDYDELIDDSKLRTSTGVGVDWFTPIGPLTMSLTIPITKEHTDETESLRFNIGTSF